MEMYKAEVKITVIKTVIKHVYVKATDAKNARQQLEVLYGKPNLVSYPQKVD